MLNQVILIIHDHFDKNPDQERHLVYLYADIESALQGHQLLRHEDLTETYREISSELFYEIVVNNEDEQIKKTSFADFDRALTRVIQRGYEDTPR